MHQGITISRQIDPILAAVFEVYELASVSLSLRGRQGKEPSTEWPHVYTKLTESLPADDLTGCQGTDSLSLRVRGAAIGAKETARLGKSYGRRKCR